MEARLVISATDATGPALAAITQKMNRLSEAAKRAGGAVGPGSVGEKATRAAGGAAGSFAIGGGLLSRVIAPAATAYAAREAITRFADVERAMTRIGITADATAAETKAATDQVQRLARDTAQPIDQVVAGLDALVAQGRTLAESLDLLRSVAPTAQASGAALDEVARSAGAIGDQFKIASKDMQGAFDIIVTGGKLGQFELKDMARYLPSLAAQASAFGLKGEEGLRNLVALLQTVRKASGTSEEAATAVKDLFGKMTSDETFKRFQKLGIDTRKTLADARKQGRDLLDVIVEMLQKATKGDLSKLNELFSDQEIRRAATALLQFTGNFREFRAQLRNVDGSTMKDFNRVLDDSRANIDRLSTSWDIFVTKLGGAIAPGVVPILDGLSRALSQGEGVPTNSPIVIPGSVPTAQSEADENWGPEDRVFWARNPAERARVAQMRARLSAQAGHLRGERDLGDLTWSYNSNDLAKLAGRARAKAAGGMTPGEAIERENALEAQLAGYMDNAIKRYGHIYRTSPGARETIRGGVGNNILQMVDEYMKIERARNGEAPPTGRELADIAGPLIQGAINAMTGSAEIVVKVETAPDMVARIVSQVKAQMPGVSLNGVGSTGKSSPDVINRGQY